MEEENQIKLINGLNNPLRSTYGDREIKQILNCNFYLVHYMDLYTMEKAEKYSNKIIFFI